MFKTALKLPVPCQQTPENTTMSPLAPKNGLLYKNFRSHPAALITSASGIYLTTNDGRNILDATSGAAVACLGYDDKDVKQAVINQLMSVPYCHPGFYKTQAADDLANFLVDSTGGQMSKAVLCGSGTTSPSSKRALLSLTLPRFRSRRSRHETGQNTLQRPRPRRTRAFPLHCPRRCLARRHPRCSHSGRLQDPQGALPVPYRPDILPRFRLQHLPRPAARRGQRRLRSTPSPGARCRVPTHRPRQGLRVRRRDCRRQRKSPPRPSHNQITDNPFRQAVAPCPSPATSPP